MSGWFPLVRAWVAQGPYGGVVDLAATADPALALVPGQRFRLAMTVTPSGGAYRTYGYLLGEDLGDAVILEEPQDLRRLPNGRYAAFASQTQAITATCVVRVRDDAPDGSVVMPRVVVGLMTAQGEKLVPSAGIEDRGFHVRRRTVPGRPLLLAPGGHVTLPGGTADGLKLSAVSPARRGMLSCAPDGSVTYQAPASYQGYDRFTCIYEDLVGHTHPSEVVIHIGDLGMSPGALNVFYG
ncbi:Ig-like domain-containing protein [Streptomyces sp. NPDC091259]|uniref:Ig-like domain-containing protein n=1 Tax=Streptomyces sp. NPDC091259 TaxID=3365976 RepID=UPI0037F92B74